MPPFPLWGKRCDEMSDEMKVGVLVGELGGGVFKEWVIRRAGVHGVCVHARAGLPTP